jgi:hypothetical protein
MAMALALLVEPAPPPLLVPDRPDLSNGIVIVPPGAAQIEVGVEATVRPRMAPRDAVGPVTSVRVGVADGVEVRVLEGAPLQWLDDDPDPSLGFGVKVRLLENDSGSGLGIQPMLQSRPSVLGARFTLPAIALTLIGSHVFGPLAAVDVNLGGRLDPLRPSVFDLFASASLGLQLHRRVLVFTEVFSAADSGPRLYVGPGCDAGVIVAIASWLSVDAAVRGSDLAEAPELAVMAGLTFGWMGRMGARDRSVAQ